MEVEFSIKWNLCSLWFWLALVCLVVVFGILVKLWFEFVLV